MPAPFPHYVAPDELIESAWGNGVVDYLAAATHKGRAWRAWRDANSAVEPPGTWGNAAGVTITGWAGLYLVAGHAVIGNADKPIFVSVRVGANGLGSAQAGVSLVAGETDTVSLIDVVTLDQTGGLSLAIQAQCQTDPFQVLERSQITVVYLGDPTFDV